MGSRVVEKSDRSNSLTIRLQVTEEIIARRFDDSELEGLKESKDLSLT